MEDLPALREDVYRIMTVELKKHKVSWIFPE
jgi:hypothetical protein